MALQHIPQPLDYVLRDATVRDLKTWQEFLEKKQCWKDVKPETRKQAELTLKNFGEVIRSRGANDVVWVLVSNKRAQAFFSLRCYEAKGWKPIAIHTPHIVLSGHGVATWHFTTCEMAQRGWGVASYEAACEVAKRMNYSQLFLFSSLAFYQRRMARVITETPNGKVMSADLS